MIQWWYCQTPFIAVVLQNLMLYKALQKSHGSRTLRIEEETVISFSGSQKAEKEDKDAARQAITLRQRREMLCRTPGFNPASSFAATLQFCKDHQAANRLKVWAS